MASMFHLLLSSSSPVCLMCLSTLGSFCLMEEVITKAVKGRIHPRSTDWCLSQAHWWMHTHKHAHTHYTRRGVYSIVRLQEENLPWHHPGECRCRAGTGSESQEAWWGRLCRATDRLWESGVKECELHLGVELARGLRLGTCSLHKQAPLIFLHNQVGVACPQEKWLVLRNIFPSTTAEIKPTEFFSVRSEAGKKQSSLRLHLIGTIYLSHVWFVPSFGWFRNAVLSYILKLIALVSNVQYAQGPAWLLCSLFIDVHFIFFLNFNLFVVCLYFSYVVYMVFLYTLNCILLSNLIFFAGSPWKRDAASLGAYPANTFARFSLEYDFLGFRKSWQSDL